MASVGTMLDAQKGYGAGFDFLRIFLALSIVAWHTATLTGHRDLARSTSFWFVEYCLVPCFFMLSGFLVAGSGMRLSLREFCLNRVIRICPALFVDVCFSALVIGPIVTVLPLSVYFAGRTFFTYGLNIFGWPHYLLPGVFESNYSISVNGALWTVPYEIGCYVILLSLISFGVIRRAGVVAGLALFLLLFAVALQRIDLAHITFGLRPLAWLLDVLFLTPGARLWPSFLIGVLFYQCRYRIPFDRRIAGAFLGLCVALAMFGNFGLFYADALFHVFMLPILAYGTVFIGLTRVALPRIFKTGDYSYGIYLYHTPFMQALLVFFPGIWRGDLWWSLFLAAAPVSLMAAMLSWHGVEKPMLRLRRSFSFAMRSVRPSEA